MKFVITQDKIEQHEATARRFFTEVLGISYDDVSATDLSTLSDFAPCGVDDDDHPEFETLYELYEFADALVIGKVRDRYSIVLSSANIKLVDLFETIEAQERGRTRH